MNEKEFAIIFSTNLRNQMYRTEISQADIARSLNVSTTIVSNWYNGKKIPRMDKIDLLCGIFGCRRSDLMLESPAPPAAPSTIDSGASTIDIVTTDAPFHLKPLEIEIIKKFRISPHQDAILSLLGLNEMQERGAG